jgi:tetratricopeptide (TPR) repeat protein
MSADEVRAAEQAFHAGDLEGAGRICSKALAANPKNASALLLSGMVAARTGQISIAVDTLRAVLELSENDYVAITWLQVVLRKGSRFSEAIEIGELARRLWPDDVDVLVNLSHAYLGTGEIDRGADCLERASAVRPKDHALHRRLGVAYELIGRDNDAANQFRTAIELEPRSEDAYVRLANLLLGHGNFSQVIELCQVGLRAVPRSAQIHLIYAQALRGVGDTEPAYRYLQKAISLDAKIVISAALWLLEDGKFEEAAGLYRKSIELQPVQGVAYYGLLKGKRTTEADRELLATMEGLIGNPALPPKERAALHYGLGHAANDLGEYERAMQHFDAGNELNFQIFLAGKNLNPEAQDRNRERIISMFTSELMSARRGLGSESDDPIFIIGMIRSGTTLVDQILSSHRDVGSAGEQRFWVNELPALVDLEAGTMDERKFMEARDRYLRVLRSFQPDAPHITDKMPLNFYCVGPIHLAFPNARFIHIQRHPVDTALSIYMTDLSKPPDFAHNKANIVREYRNYLAMMRHWRTVIPPSNLLEVRYEDLISNPELWSRRMLDFCGLPWVSRQPAPGEHAEHVAGTPTDLQDLHG